MRKAKIDAIDMLARRSVAVMVVDRKGGLGAEVTQVSEHYEQSNLVFLSFWNRQAQKI